MKYMIIVANQYFPIVEAIPESVSTDTVTITIRRLLDGYYWNFSTLAFQVAEASGSMTWDYDIFWKQSFTPPTEDTYMVLIEDSTLDVKYPQAFIAVSSDDYPTAILGRTSTSDIAICNLALAHIGVSPIVSLTDELESARALNRIYEISRDAVLRAKAWRFASVKAPLAELADQTCSGWGYVYGYPVKCLCIRKIFVDTGNKNPPPIEYETLLLPSINRKVIACDYEDAYAEYTYQVVDATLFDVSFVMAFSFLLAAQIAKPLTGDDTIAKTMLQIYGSMVSDAARINDIEKNIKPTESSSFEDAR
ncbi:MAG: hypothetical protein C4540_04590 [Candidatus Omnitrophota bacterium]|jgi:hypothetical protein|nr:MAG: hypothetical protein C4540_04590 [Candidatus Omnitrophota bacterium]